MNPYELLQGKMVRPPLPGEVWTFTKDEAHCFQMEIEHLGGYLDEDEPGASHWISAVRQALKSGKSVTTNSTPELFAFANGHLASARVRQMTLRPDDLEICKRAVSDPLIRLEMEITEEEAELRLLDAEKGIARLSCEHTAFEHQRVMLGWYERNIEATQFRRATLYRVWDLPLEERIHGKQFLARYDMEREIAEAIEERNRCVIGFHDTKARDMLILKGRPLDEVEELLDDIRRTSERKLRELLVESAEKEFRILE